MNLAFCAVILMFSSKYNIEHTPYYKGKKKIWISSARSFLSIAKVSQVKTGEWIRMEIV